MTLRTFLTSLLALLALPRRSKAGVEATGTFRVVESARLCVADAEKVPNTLMVFSASFATQATELLISQGFPLITIHWINVFDAETNPDTQIGFFRAIGRSPAKPQPFVERAA